jgi:hypothetical protein
MSRIGGHVVLYMSTYPEETPSPNAQIWFAQNPVEWAKIVARLMREAGDVYKLALDERH